MLRMDGYTIEGESRAGLSTSIRIPELRLAFDIGAAHPEVIQLPRILITHGHADHAAGIPYYLARRRLLGMPEAELHLPPGLVEPMKEILASWERIEDVRYRYRIERLEEDRVVSLGREHRFRAFPVEHRIEAWGYVIYRIRKKLRRELAGLPGPAIAARRKAGEPVDDITAVPTIAFTGDTTIEGIARVPEFQRSRILILECTFLRGAVPPERAHAGGHLHVDDIVRRPDLFPNPHVVLTHFSERHHPEDIPRLVEEALPEELLSRVRLLL